jgi:hypothetical protein
MDEPYKIFALKVLQVMPGGALEFGLHFEPSSLLLLKSL